MKKDFERVTPESVGIPSEVLLKFLDCINELPTEMHGFMLMRHGKVCSEFWWEPFGRDVKHGSNSLAKTYTGTAVGLAVTEGLLDLEERLVDIFPEYEQCITDEKMKRVRIKDMLSMSAGFAEEIFGPTDDTEQYMARPLAYEPGEKFFYHNGTASALGAVVQKRTGMSMEAYLSQKVFNRIGIETDNFEWLKETGSGLDAAAGGILSTTEQNLRLMKLYADGGMADGEQIISRDFIENATRTWHKVTSSDTGYLENADIGYAWMMWRADAYNTYLGRGALGQIAMVMPDLDLIVSMHQNSERTKDLEVAQKFWELVVPYIQDGPIDSDGNAYKQLQEKTGHLKLQDAQLSERYDFEKTISGKTFICEDGFEMINETFNMMTNAPKGEPIRKFSLSFNKDSAGLITDKLRIEIGLDGESRRCSITENGYTQEVLSCGNWISEKVFEIFVRWMGFSKCKVYRFDFGRSELEVFGFVGNQRMIDPLYKSSIVPEE